MGHAADNHLVALAIVLTPVWLIQPFAPQSQRGLKISYIMRSWSPLLTLLASLLAVTLVFRYGAALDGGGRKPSSL